MSQDPQRNFPHKLEQISRLKLKDQITSFFGYYNVVGLDLAGESVFFASGSWWKDSEYDFTLHYFWRHHKTSTASHKLSCRRNITAYIAIRICGIHQFGKRDFRADRWTL